MWNRRWLFSFTKASANLCCKMTRFFDQVKTSPYEQANCPSNPDSRLSLSSLQPSFDRLTAAEEISHYVFFIRIIVGDGSTTVSR